jgi:hypothetical protein
MSLQHSLVWRASFGCRDVNKQIFAFDGVLAGLKGVQIIGFQELYHVFEKWIH